MRDDGRAEREQELAEGARGRAGRRRRAERQRSPAGACRRPASTMLKERAGEAEADEDAGREVEASAGWSPSAIMVEAAGVEEGAAHTCTRSDPVAIGERAGRTAGRGAARGGSGLAMREAEDRRGPSRSPADVSGVRNTPSVGARRRSRWHGDRGSRRCTTTARASASRSPRRRSWREAKSS